VRERECLRWCKAGKSAWDISRILGISERTAQFHISNAMAKLGAPNRITAVVMAIQRGLLSL
jgi:DNA-binding CsgD family transcriptional regulator